MTELYCKKLRLLKGLHRSASFTLLMLAGLATSAVATVKTDQATVAATASIAATKSVYQSHDSITEAARNYIFEKTSKSLDIEPDITVNRLDTRLLLSQCSSELETFSSPTERFVGHSTVGVRCLTPKPWTLYVQAHIIAYADVLVSTRALQRGEYLSPSDISVERKELGNLPAHYLDQPEQVKGQVIKRPIQRGTILSYNILEAAKLVHRGQKVSLLAERNGIQIRLRGQSLSDGVAGQRVRIKNLRSNRIIEAIVIDEGVVKVIL